MAQVGGLRYILSHFCAYIGRGVGKKYPRLVEYSQVAPSWASIAVSQCVHPPRVVRYAAICFISRHRLIESP